MDQLYLLEICEAISSRLCPVTLHKGNPFEIVHSMRLTVDYIVPRLYVSSSEQVRKLVDSDSFYTKSLSNWVE